MSLHRIATSRRTLQALLLAGLLLIPFIVINGNPMLRMDIGQRTLFLAGAAVRIDQFYLVLLAVLLLVAVFLLLTVVLGRVWCGWFCPQTVLNDLVELSRVFLRPLLPERSKTIVVHLFVLLLALLFSINLLCWFMHPAEIVKNLFALSLHPVATLSFSLVFIAMYLNLIFIKRTFCRSYCPYGRFQAAILDESTLNLAFREEDRGRCIDCGTCLRACPMGIDIRQGFQIECINCGRCIDACRGVMERLNGKDGLIDYRFGQRPGAGPRIGFKSLLLAVLVCTLSVVLVWSMYTSSDTAFSVQKIATVETKIFPDGSRVQAWRAIIGNRDKSPAVFSLGLSPRPGLTAELLGPVSAIRVAPNEIRQVSFFIRFNNPVSVRQPFELLLLKTGIPVTIIRVTP